VHLPQYQIHLHVDRIKGYSFYVYSLDIASLTMAINVWLRPVWTYFHLEEARKNSREKPGSIPGETYQVYGCISQDKGFVKVAIYFLGVYSS